MSFLDTVWTKMKEIFSEIATFCGPFMKQFETQVGPVVLAAAEQAVGALVASEMPGASKRTAAFAQITDNLKTQGITVAASVINSAIEAAVAKLKSDAGAAGAAPAQG
jgi:hypothetical protein